VKENFAKALKLVLVDEGGLDDDPRDHGGRTAYGITQREYDAYLLRRGFQSRDVWKITPSEYEQIYHDQYWSPWCDKLPAGIDYAYFDCAVNAGPSQAARTLQRALRNVPVDGHMGERTLAAALSRDPEALIAAFCNERRRFYRALKQFPVYGRGWLNRVNHVERAAKELAATGGAQRYGLSDDIRQMATAKALPSDTKRTALDAESGGLAVAGGGTITMTLASLKDEIKEYKDQIAGVGVICLALTVGLAIYTIYAAFKRKKIQESV
jgi:lysozyme family protein